MKYAVRWLLSLSLLALFVVACGESVSPTAPDTPAADSKSGGKLTAQTGPGSGTAGPGDCGAAGPGSTGCGTSGSGGGNPGLPGGGTGGGGGGGAGGGGGIGGGGGGGTGLPAPAPGTCPFQNLGSQTGLDLVTGQNETAGDDFKSNVSVCGVDGAEDVAFSWSAPSTACFQIDTNGSDYDTVLRLYDTCAGTEFRCNDDAGTGLDSLIWHPFTSGDSSIIIVDGFSSGSRGTYTLNIEAVDDSFCFGLGITPTPTPTPTPVPCNIGFNSPPPPVNVTALNPATASTYQSFPASVTIGFGNGQSVYTDDSTFPATSFNAFRENNAWIKTARADSGLAAPDPLLSFSFNSTCNVSVWLAVDDDAGIPAWVAGTGFSFTGAGIVAGTEDYTWYRRNFGSSGSLSLGPPGAGNENYFVVLSSSTP